ncbi:putative membrane protein YgcG [Bartonella chomelii]|uniref:Membrane protein YgcG n=1 Tax=Bartonella chomelii TaxID=236402 RepID=A0ABR6E137_9HYPH|nr:putative membrane protein YgcG [Bartonella chomelii]
MLAVASNERKVCIEVGYDLEKELTDAISAVIIDNFIFPNFHEGNYQKGIIESVNTITEVITGSNSNVMSRMRAKAKIIEAQSKQTEKEEMIANTIFFFIFFLVVGLLIFVMIFL